MPNKTPKQKKQQDHFKKVAKGWAAYKKKHPGAKYQTYMKNNL